MLERFKEKKYYNFITLIIFSIIKYGGDALFYSYAVRFYKSFSFSDGQLGLLLSLIPFMSVLGNLFISKFANTQKKNMIFIRIWMFLEGAAIFFIGFFENYYSLLIFAIIANFCNNSFYNLFDVFIVQITKKINKTYTAGRIFGTISYVGFSLLGGLLISSISYKYTFIIGGSLYFLGFLFFNFFDLEQIKESKESKVKTKEVFQNRYYVFYLVFIILAYGIYLLTDTMFSLYTKDLQISDSLFGAFFAGAIAVEALIMYIFGVHFNSVRYYHVSMFVSCFAFALRLFVFAIPNLNQYVYLSFELLRGVGWGFLLSGNINNLQNILGKRLFSKGLFIALTFIQLFSAVVSLFLPSLISATSYSIVFIIFGGLVLVSMLFFYLSIPKINYLEIEKLKDNIDNDNVV